MFTGLGFFFGFAIGQGTAPKIPTNEIRAAVDCYDSKGNLIEDKFFKQFGGATVACADGQIARLHQSNPPAHIETH